MIDEPIMIAGVDRECPVVINLDEKLTAVEEPINRDGIANLVERTLVSLIGEDSNAATCYHNKMPKTAEQKKKYESYVDILSIVNSFAIDFAKTGYIMNIPYHIAKYSKPYPYFMRYISEYYENLYQSMERTKSAYRFNKNQSNMNKLAFFIDKFHNKEVKWKRRPEYLSPDGFDYTIMMDSSLEVTEDEIKAINEIYRDFNEQVKYLSSFERKLHQYDKYKSELKAWDKESAISYKVNWQSVYDKYKNRCEEIIPDQRKLANAAVMVCYGKHKSSSKRFMWVVASAGILENIKQVEFGLPCRDDDGEFTYLGRRYSIRQYPFHSSMD